MSRLTYYRNILLSYYEFAKQTCIDKVHHVVYKLAYKIAYNIIKSQTDNQLTNKELVIMVFKKIRKEVYNMACKITTCLIKQTTGIMISSDDANKLAELAANTAIYQVAEKATHHAFRDFMHELGHSFITKTPIPPQSPYQIYMKPNSSFRNGRKI